MKFQRIAAAALAFSVLFGSVASAKSSSSAPVVSAALQSSESVVSDSPTVDTSDLPSKVDLRDRGIVPPVRDQDPWGTCWGFGSIAACEISILSDLGLTCEQFKEKYGYELDLSERHLAWYATYHMPDVTGNSDDLSEQEISQAGEGQHNSIETTSPNNAHYNIGGFTTIASSVFSAGFGPVMESDVPYTANDGTKSEDSDWSVSESYRFTTEFDLLDSNIFPAPAQTDADGNYVYNAQATAAIKREIANGHAVAIGYHADASTPSEAKQSMNISPKASSSDDDTSYDDIEEMILDMGYSEDEAEIVLSFLTTGSTEGLSDDDKYLCAEICIYLVCDEDTADTLADELDEGEIEPDDILSEIIQDLYDDSDASDSSSGETVYINYETYAQYTDNVNEDPDHIVCIIGYDDDYAVDNFLADHQPPAPGAWICRNSWGATWGNDGYFYLSYYDQTIVSAESFTFDITDFDNETETLEILNYDFMQINAPVAVYPESEVMQACVYTTDDDDVLVSASLFTAT